MDNPAEKYEALLVKHNKSWADFEDTQWGEIELDGIWFRLRVGRHMNKPMCAIIAGDVFVRMKEAPEYASSTLEKLDPTNALACTYRMVRPVYPDGKHNQYYSQTWMPSGNWFKKFFGRSPKP